MDGPHCVTAILAHHHLRRRHWLPGQLAREHEEWVYVRDMPVLFKFLTSMLTSQRESLAHSRARDPRINFQLTFDQAGATGRGGQEGSGVGAAGAVVGHHPAIARDRVSVFALLGNKITLAHSAPATPPAIVTGLGFVALVARLAAREVEVGDEACHW